MQQTNHIIHAKWIITCEDKNQTLENHSLIIRDQTIIDILSTEEAKQKYSAKNVHNYASHALLPGFINAHTHIAMNMFRGFADDLELMDWLTQYIWPAEQKWVGEEFVYDASQFAIAEMIKSGTTCFNDMYFFLQATARAVDEAGLRAHIGMHIIEVPTQWANTVDEYFAKGLEFYEEYKNHPRITPTIAPHSSYALSKVNLERVKALADQYNLRINMHCQESKNDVEGSIKLNHQRPLQCVNDIDLVSPNLIAIHMTQLDEKDFEILRTKKPNIVHCPESNMKLASGICPVNKLIDLGLNVALGTDGAASNNDLDMIGEMRTAAFLAKLSTQDPKTLPAETVLKMATLNGAKALGIDKITGSLTPGKAADFIAIDLGAIESLPLYHPISQIVYSASRNQVTDVWVAGKQLLKNRKLLTLDEEELIKKAESWGKKIKN